MIVLQKFGFKESRYERPQDAWVCGRLADGKPCDLGPGGDGRCRVTTVCQPRLEGDRWQCRRSANAGGPCQAGPLPDGQCCMTLERCVPRPSLRAKRKRGALAAVALIVGVLAVAMGGEAGRHFMMPGRLSSHHAGLTDCSTCHAGARSGKVDLLHRLVTTVEPRQNSNLCVTCHVMGAEPFTPHTHPIDDLKRLTETLRLKSKDAPAESPIQRVVFPARSRGAEAEVPCATCHKEHQGVFADLKAVSNQRCQSCHVSRFGSFASSHPQFDKYPYQRRPRIIFDHQSHMSKHFPDAVKAAIAGQVAPDNCADCHQPGVRKRYMVVKSFESMCAGCHNGDITGVTQVSGPKGIDVIAVPALDVATLREHGIDIGYWPKDSEAAVTPFMGLLLESNGENVVSAVAGLNLLDLSKASDQDLARVAALAWAIKRLFNRLETTNPAAGRARAGAKSGNKVDPLQMAALAGGMSHDVVMAGNREWFPDLQDDLQRHERGEPTRSFTPPPKPKIDAAMPPPSAGGNAAAMTKAPGAASSDDILAPAGGGSGNADILSSDKNDILGPDKSDASAASKSDDILAGSSKDDGPTKSDKDDILSGNKSDAGNILSATADDSSKKDDASASAEAKTPADATPVPFDPEAWAQTGGWYRDDFTIRYRPTGHADQFLQTWLDLAGRGHGAGLHDKMTPVFAELAPKDAVGRCTKCHSVDDEAGAKVVNWHPFDPNAINNRFTNYSHKPHVELIGAKTCVRCHELQPTDSGFLKTYEGGDPVNYTPNFKHLDKALCAECHSQQTAWESCTLCHGYHVPDVSSAAPKPALPVAFERPTASAPDAETPSLDPDAKVRVDYDIAAGTGTKQAWNDFVASHPSGHYHDLAVQQLARLAAPAPETTATDQPENSGPVAPGKPAAVAPDQSISVTPEKSAAVSSDNSPQTAPAKSAMAIPGESANTNPGDSASITSARPLDAGAGEPTDLDGIFRRGLKRALGGDFELAIQDFDEVIRRDPRHAGALNNRCWALAMLDEVQAALKDCNESLRIAPNFADAFDSRGLVNLKLGYYNKAIADYTSALSHDPKRASALYGRGIAARRSGRAASAKTDINAAKHIQPAIVDEFAGYGIQ
ncbi:tetratricopeptide repeat protein [Bradyrhizobium diazoefficiens]|nr:tetratricopeptide repeat protein [Bradyrhizobium diazoefficiens]QQO23274.1 tetratricopeptide repeat protein [Bradyrhizobium diazoefficiens]